MTQISILYDFQIRNKGLRFTISFSFRREIDTCEYEWWSRGSEIGDSRKMPANEFIENEAFAYTYYGNDKLDLSHSTIFTRLQC